METNKFHEVRNRVFALCHQRRYGKALEVAEWAQARFPEQEGVIAFWTACLKCLVSDQKGALQILEEALERGHWWGERWLLGDPDLALIRDHPRFRRIVEECKRREQAAQAEAVPKLLVLPPEGKVEKPPLLIALHGAGGTAEGTLPYWAPARQMGVLVALPQSSQVVHENGYGWGNVGLAKKELAAHWEQLRRRHPFDPDRVVIAGASQGGKLAIELALAGVPIPTHGFIAVVPAIRDPERLARNAGEAAARGVQGWLLTGERDQFKPAVEEFHTLLLDGGFRCELTVIPKLGHDFPGDFPTRLSQALNFCLG